MKKLLQLLHLSEADVLLDVGGHPSTWTWFQQPVARIDILNVSPIDSKNSSAQSHNIQTLVGDGCNLGFGDRHYDVVFSNSVIEHVGDKDRHRAFAGEVRRVGRKLWIQTPAYEFFIEPHYLTPFVHWIPIDTRKKYCATLQSGGWITRPSKKAVNQMGRLLHTTRSAGGFVACIFGFARVGLMYLRLFPKEGDVWGIFQVFFRSKV